MYGASREEGIGSPSSGGGPVACSVRCPGALAVCVRHGRVERPEQEPPEVAADPAGVGAGVRQDRLARDAPESAVVVVPAPRAVGEDGEVVVHAGAAGGEERLEVDPPRPVRLVREQLAGDGRGELLGRRAVAGLHDPVGHEGPEEERRRSAAHDREVVPAHLVVHRQRTERHEHAGGERRGRGHPGAAAVRGDERHEPEQHEHLPDGARVDRRRDAQAEHPGARGRGELGRPHEQQCDERERGREERVARELVEEQDVARVEEERRGGREGRQRTEAPGDAEPGDEREARTGARRRSRRRPAPPRGARR